jgi:4-cresol dehydrogenase (hydroxylating)
MRIPQGTSEADFKAALQEFTNVVGPDWVFTSDEDVAAYRDAYSPFVGQPDKMNVAGAAVSPTTVEQVQQIVRIANKYTVPLFAISTGRNLGYGGSSPPFSGSVIVDLKRMNKVVEVNETEAYMIVEPGLSFIDMHRHLTSIGSNLRLSAPQPGWGSPIGNGLDHGHGDASFNGDNFSMVKGLEVVLPSGELLRTGCGAVPGSKLWMHYEYGFGPYINGMFSQSNFGIVTKACFWLTPNWEVQQSFTIESDKTDDMQRYIDALLPLRNEGVLHGWGITSPIRESGAHNDGRHPYGPKEVYALLHSPEGGTVQQWDDLGRSSNIPAARGMGSMRGAAPVVAAQLAYARERLKGLPGNFTVGKPIYGKDWLGPRIDFGIIAIQETSHGHFYFSPMFKAQAKDIFAINDTIRRVMIEHNDYDMLDNFCWSGTRGAGPDKYMLILLEFLVHDDIDLNNRRLDLFRALVKTCGENGWPEYRTPSYMQDIVMNQYSFNDHALRRFHETIKDAIDPSGILAPGKAGVWPKRLRKT